MSIPRRFYQGLEQTAHRRIVGGQRFGMPLDTDGKGMSRDLDPLDQAVGRIGHGRQVRRQCLEALMVQAVDGHGVAADDQSGVDPGGTGGWPSCWWAGR